MEDCRSLNELILAIVALSTKFKDEKSPQLVGTCAEFCICLIQYLEETPSSAVNAVNGFLREMREIESFDYNIEASVKNAEERVAQSITTIKASHPALGDIKGGPRQALPGTVVTVLDIGIPVIAILRDAAEVVGTVPFLKPVFAAVLVMFQAARQTQFNFDEMMSLSTTTGEFALIIVERCSASQESPPNLDAAIRQLESQLHDIALRCQEISRKSFMFCFLQSASLKEELDGLRKSLDVAIQKFQTICLIDFHDEMRRMAENIGASRI
ncbi:hypothetical protein EST38_g13248 [Candolleomyces aberdarensis]|uniref:Fungal STAND N-terminal Goodbye domain-containing protein n=1 Tax=Candolleomyces aberdarensis TaxID=2316362 RepID=A0A4Q2D2B9_9AGAR|nr:hypothetical protein EST38_g13248 [Candolleomyces aberdarensis]